MRRVGRRDGIYMEYAGGNRATIAERSTTSNRTGIPDTPEERKLRNRLERELRAERGDNWVGENQALLDDQWEFAKEPGIIQTSAARSRFARWRPLLPFPVWSWSLLVS